VVELIERAHPGLVLDFGSGNAPDRHDNLIKMEIYAFPNVDVVGLGEKTPFVDGSFRAVFAGAVFEHVVSPSRCAREVHRLLEAGGEIYVETAFLQPFHAYPNHFFNMTTQGAREVFKMFEELDVGVQPHQDPSFTLSWVLSA
jgi:ubiquinone/menaquinone biosynthesis C-methylase UbiE